MKLYIDQDYLWTHWCSPSASDDEIDEWHDTVREWCAVADLLGCSHSVSYTGSGADVRLHQQKCTLDEWSMNALLDGFITNMFRVSLSYAPIGGEGCDFALRLECIPRVLQPARIRNTSYKIE